MVAAVSTSMMAANAEVAGRRSGWQCCQARPAWVRRAQRRVAVDAETPSSRPRCCQSARGVACSAVTSSRSSSSSSADRCNGGSCGGGSVRGRCPWWVMCAFREWAAAVDLRSLRWVRGRPQRRFTGWTGCGGRAEEEHTVNRITARRIRRTVEPLVVLAAVAALAAPAFANPPPDNPPGPSVSGRTVAAVRSLSDRNPWPDPPPRSFGIDVPGGGTRDNGPRVATAGTPPDPPPVDSVSGRTVAAVRNLSDKDPWPDPPLRSFDIDVSGGGTRDNGPRAATAGPPPIVVED